MRDTWSAEISSGTMLRAGFSLEEMKKARRLLRVSLDCYCKTHEVMAHAEGEVFLAPNALLLTCILPASCGCTVTFGAQRERE
jgi:hypothetical protein